MFVYVIDCDVLVASVLNLAVPFPIHETKATPIAVEHRDAWDIATGANVLRTRLRGSGVNTDSGGCLFCFWEIKAHDRRHRQEQEGGTERIEKAGHCEGCWWGTAKCCWISE